MLRPSYAWVNRVVGASKQRPVRKRRASLPRLIAGMETLEDRTLLATVTVHIYSDNFSTNPSGQPVVAPTIHTGDTIHWVWDSGTHTTTSVAGSVESWNSGTHTVGDVFDHTFTHSGTFSYYCKFHGSDNGNGSAAGMSGTVTVISLQSIAITPADPSVVKGNTEQFTAIGTFSDNSTLDLTNQVTWASATSTVATISAAGLATTLTNGTSTISAVDGTVSASTVLTVTPGVLQSIAVTPATPTVIRGQTEQFTATGSYSDNSTLDLTNQVTWASATPAVATISAAGLATTVTAGTSSISAKLGTVAGTTLLTVTPAALQSIVVTPDTPSLALGRAEQFAATGTFSDNSTMDLTNQVTWASATPAVATISAAGLASTLATGSSSISATLGAIAGTTVLTVTPAVLQSIAVTPDKPSVAQGRTEQFTAKGTLTDGSTADLTSQVTWVSATPTVATIAASGLASTLATGTSTISAQLAGISGSTVLTVSPAVLASIAVTPAAPSIAKGLAEPFTATATLTDHTTSDVTAQVTWASGTPAVATINAAGLATTLATGASSISATLSGITGSTTLVVNPAAVVSIAVTRMTQSLAVGTSEQFTATGTYTDDTTQNLSSQVTWASSAPAVATIDATGLASGQAAGRSSISANLGGLSGSASLTVKVLTLLSISIKPSNPSLPKGETEPFLATGTFDDNSTQDLSNQVTWTSSTPGVASILASGVATALTLGQTTITATRAALTNSIVLTVTPAALLSVTVAPANSVLPKGETRQFTATGRYSDNTVLDLTDQVSWASTSPTVASIAATGLATALKTGSVSVTARLDGITDSTVLTVSPAALLSIALAPAAPSLPLGEMLPFAAVGTYSDNTVVDLTNQVTWGSATPSVAAITSAGSASALSLGTSSIRASLGVVSGSTTLTVSPAALMQIMVMPLDQTIFRGKTKQFMAMGMYSDGTMQDLTSGVAWSSSAPSISTVDAGGLASGVAAGSSTITASLGDVSGTTLLTVIPATLVSITIAPADSSLAKGRTAPFTAMGNYADGSTQDLSSQVTWTSTSPTVAAISATGLVTAIAPGRSTIGAALGGTTSSTQLDISSPTLASIVIAAPGQSLSKGASEPLTATGVFTDNSTQDLTHAVAWTSSNTSVATVSTSGVAAALAAGTSSITARLGNLAASTVLTVTPAVLLSISISPAHAGLLAGQTETFTATGTYSDNTTQDLNGRVGWTSSATAVATITASGVASAASAGSASITATLGGVSATTVLSVTSPVTIPPNPLFVATGVKIKARAHRKFSGAVANFKDPHTAAADFHASIDWGDGSAPTDGHVRRTGNGRYTVSGSHQYGAAGSFLAVVTIRDAQGRDIAAQSSVQVRK